MAYEFNGTNQFLSTASLASFAEPFTLACWFYPDSLANFGSLCGVQNLSNGHRAVLFADPTVGNKMQAGTHAAGAFARSTTDYVASAWQHACGVYTSTASRTAYLNGGGSATNTTSYSPTYGTPIIASGARNNGSAWGLYFDGRTAEVGIWSAALTQQEIQSLAAGYTCDKVRPQSLVAYFPLVRDLVELKSGLAVTNNNSATVANHPRVYA